MKRLSVAKRKALFDLVAAALDRAGHADLATAIDRKALDLQARG